MTNDTRSLRELLEKNSDGDLFSNHPPKTAGFLA